MKDESIDHPRPRTGAARASANAREHTGRIRWVRPAVGGLLLAFWLASAAIAGQPGPDGYRRGPPDQRNRQDQRPGPQPNAPDQRRMERDQQQRGTLSEEDRRSLHRDLDKANRELYRRR